MQLATTAFSTVTQRILYRHGHTGPDTYRTAAGTVFPGAAVSTGTTLTKDCKLGTANLIFLGIAGLLPNHDIDTVYATGTAIPVYTRNSGAIVWAQFLKNVSAVASQPLNQGGATVTGTVTPGEGGLHEFAGVAYRDITVAAADETPGLIHLVLS